MAETVLIIDDDASSLHMAEYAIQHKLYYRTVISASEKETIAYLQSAKPQPDLALLDLTSPHLGGMELLRQLKALRPQLPVLVFVPYGDQEQAARAVASGASDFLHKPVSIERLRLSLQQALKFQRLHNYIGWLERRVAGHMDLTDIIGQSPRFHDALSIASDASASKMPVWINGQIGTGKELFARAIHGSSDRAGKPFVMVNCETTPAHLLAGMLFGQEQGPLPGKLQFSLGKLREADQGTLFIEEIQLLPPDLQQRLMQVLDNGEVIPQGGRAGVPADVRLICATSVNLDRGGVPERVDPKLYQRLKGFLITLPPLKARPDDIRLLAEHFLAMYAASENKYIRGLTEEGMQWLMEAPWPGNVHQLANTLWRAVMLCDGDKLGVDELAMAQSSGRLRAGGASRQAALAESVLVDGQGKVRTLKSIQKEAIRFALQHAGGCMTHAARSLGIGRSTLYRKVSELDLTNYISRANQTTRPMMNVSSGERS